MSHDENLSLAHRAWEAVASGDIEALQQVWADDIRWHVTGNNPWSGTHFGREAVCDYLADVGEAGEDYQTTLDDLLVNKDRLVMICTVRARRGRKTVETGQILMARVESGKIVEVWTMPLDPAAFEGFWERPSEDENAAIAQ